MNDFILENGLCRDPLDYIQNECESHNVQGSTDYERQRCFYCQKDRVPINLKDNFSCIEENTMKYFQNKLTLDTNCLLYDNDNDKNYFCMRCKFPTVLHEGTCLTTCPESTTLYKQYLQPYNRDADRANDSYSI